MMDFNKYEPIKGRTFEELYNYCKSNSFPGSCKYEYNHPIWDCHVGTKRVSPKEAWYDQGLLYKAVDNLYKIYYWCVNNNKYLDFIKRIDKAFDLWDISLLQEVALRFTVAKIAPKVTALAPTTMLRILKEANINLDDYSGVYVPMAGFGGIVEAIRRYSKDVEIEAYDINQNFCDYYGWGQRDVLAKKIVTDKIVIVCPPFGENYERWGGTPDNMYYSFREWCDLIIEYIDAPNYIFIGPTDKNEESNKIGLFQKTVGIKWYPEYTK